MSKELSSGFCEVCGVDVSPNTDLKRFGKLFCSPDHMEQYTKARQKAQGEDEGYEENRGKKSGKGWRSTLKELLRGCC